MEINKFCVKCLIKHWGVPHPGIFCLHEICISSSDLQKQFCINGRFTKRTSLAGRLEAPGAVGLLSALSSGRCSGRSRALPWGMWEMYGMDRWSSALQHGWRVTLEPSSVLTGSGCQPAWRTVEASVMPHHWQMPLSRPKCLHLTVSPPTHAWVFHK